MDSFVMPSSVKQAIAAKQRPPASARCQMVNRIVDDCRQKVPNLERSMFNAVAAKLVALYSESFRDTIPVSEHGSDSLAKQLRDRFDNEKRPVDLTPKEVEAPAIKQAYGCVQWNPSLPEKATEESQETIKEALKNMYRLSPKEWDWKLIKKYMEDSFYLQRKEINGALAEAAAASKLRTRRKKKKDNEENEEPEAEEERVSAQDIKKSWPFMFTSRGMNYHCFHLLKVDIRDHMFNFIQDEGNLLIEFLACRGQDLSKIKMDMVKAERNNLSNTKLPTILRMLSKALKDDVSLLLRFTEVNVKLTYRIIFIQLVNIILIFRLFQSTTSVEELSTTVTLPPGGTPVIVAAGKMTP